MIRNYASAKDSLLILSVLARSESTMHSKTTALKMVKWQNQLKDCIPNMKSLWKFIIEWFFRSNRSLALTHTMLEKKLRWNFWMLVWQCEKCINFSKKNFLRTKFQNQLIDASSNVLICPFTFQEKMFAVFVWWDRLIQH